MRPNGHAIKAFRKARKMSLRDLQKLTGLNRGYLWRIETGAIEATADMPVLKVATALDVPPDAITHKEKT